jgi:hypothetical protein
VWPLVLPSLTSIEATMKTMSYWDDDCDVDLYKGVNEPESKRLLQRYNFKFFS